TPTKKPTPTSTPTVTSQVLPGPYQTSLLNPLDTPHTYIKTICQYLRDKWSLANSVPGTVVMVIMFHQITDETLITPEEISEYSFRQLMKKLHDNGFQAITTLQLDGFLEHNSKIPERSVLLVIDDKHSIDYFNGLFRQYWIDYGWPVVNAWISDDLTTSDLWKQLETWNAEGWVDYQAHGVVSDPITQNSTDDYILGELKGPIDVFREHFNKTPIAIIWPGGGFTPKAVSMARQLGYRLGFTINPRGPLMFNWVPLADSGDPARDTWIPEGPVKDPLMVLPRYWDTDASLHLNEVIQIGQEAAAYANANKSTEMDYYNLVCSPFYGAIP
ncbi:MAG: polysaccharide deacetylase family protein, partial [Anaerolineales bacterium]